MGRRSEFFFEPKDKLEEIKFEICRVLDYQMQYERMSQQDLAKKLGTSQSAVSRVRNRKVKEVTFNQLFRYLAILNPKFKILIAPR